MSNEILDLYKPTILELNAIFDATQQDSNVEMSPLAFMAKLAENLVTNNRDMATLTFLGLVPFNIVVNPELAHEIFMMEQKMLTAGEPQSIFKGSLYTVVAKSEGGPGNVVAEESGALHIAVRKSFEEYIDAAKIKNFAVNSIQRIIKEKLCQPKDTIEKGGITYAKITIDPEELNPIFFKNTLDQLTGPGFYELEEQSNLYSDFKEQLKKVANATFAHVSFSNNLLQTVLSPFMSGLQHLVPSMNYDVGFFRGLGDRAIKFALQSQEDNLLKTIHSNLSLNSGLLSSLKLAPAFISKSDKELIHMIMDANVGAWIEAVYATTAVSMAKMMQACARYPEIFASLEKSKDMGQFAYEALRVAGVVPIIGREIHRVNGKDRFAEFGITGNRNNLLIAMPAATNNPNFFPNPRMINLERSDNEKEWRRLIFGEPVPRKSAHLDNRHCPGEGAIVAVGTDLLTFFKEKGIIFEIGEQKPLKYGAVITDPTEIHMLVPQSLES